MIQPSGLPQPGMSWPWPKEGGWTVVAADGKIFLVGPRGETYLFNGVGWQRLTGGPA